MNGRTAAEASATALDAALTLAEGKVAPLVGIHAPGKKRVCRVGDGVGAVLADGADQALGEDAVERGDEVVDLDTHIDEAAEHVDHVVGVDGGEDQMAGERGVDGDLGSFVVADFADQDLVRVVTQDRAQAAGKREALFLVHRNLGDPADLVFDRVLDGDDLVFVALDFVERGVERGSFAGTSRAGDQHHAVGLADVAAEPTQVIFGEADNIEGEVAELLAHRFFVEHAEHRIFAVHRGHDADTEVDQAAFVTHSETAILGDAALGNVELAHDLDARQDGGVVFAGDRRHGHLQHAVDAVLYDHRVVVGFNANIGGAALERGEDGGVDQANNGADVFFAGELLDGDVFFRVFIAGQHVEGEAFAGFVQHALRLLGFFQQVSDLRQGRHASDDAIAEQAGYLIENHQARGI